MRFQPVKTVVVGNLIMSSSFVWGHKNKTGMTVVGDSSRKEAYDNTRAQALFQVEKVEEVCSTQAGKKGVRVEASRVGGERIFFFMSGPFDGVIPEVLVLIQ